MRDSKYINMVRNFVLLGYTKEEATKIADTYFRIVEVSEYADIADRLNSIPLN